MPHDRDQKSVAARIALKVLRTVSPLWRARTELFYEPYKSWVEWQSGLGDAGRVLHALVRMTKPGLIVETGSARGFSTCCLALACAENNRGSVFAIDPHVENEWTDVGTEAHTYDFLKQRIHDYGLESYCSVMRMTSASAATEWNKPIDLLFIDGDHSLEGVRADFEGFAPWLTADAIVAFHDSAWEHERPWESYKSEPWYRSDMGVPAYLDQLQRDGYCGVTFLPTPGLTIMHCARGGFEFLRRKQIPEGRTP